MNNKTIPSLPESNVEQRIEELKDVPARNSLRASSGRARFLSEAAGYRQAVSPRTQMRQSGWISQIRKEKLAMNVLVSLILAASLLLGSSATVAAAQDELPNQPLYQLKLWTEDATLALAGTPQEQANQLIDMAQTRVEEMAALAEQGITPPDQVRDRLETHLQQTLMLATHMDETTREQTLLQLRDHLQTQDRILAQLQTHVNAQTEPLLTRTRDMLQTHLRQVDTDLANLQGSRYMLENQMQYGQDEAATPEPNRQGEPGFHQNDQGGQQPADPGSGNRNGNDVSGKETQSGQNSNNGSCVGAGCGGGNSGGGNCSGSGCDSGRDGQHNGGGNK
jgi:hypothetical protein